MDNFECFRLEKKKHIAHLVFSRPEKRNTMSMAFFRELREVMAYIDEQEDLRVVLITAEGKSFTAGLDLMEASSLFKETNAGSRHNFRKMIMDMQDCFTAVERCRKPVIAAVHSHCIGGGVDLMCVCDIRMASQDAVFSIRETRLAMVADLGTLQRITPIIGDGWTRELAFTGRDFNAAHALKIGLITHMYPQRDRLYQEAFRLAEEISDMSPVTIQGLKETMNYSRIHGVAAGLEYVAQKNSAILPSEDIMEAFQAFMEKRKPTFTGR